MSETMERTRRRTMALMDESGHMTWTWDEDNDEQIIPQIERMMAEGYVFWIVKRDPLREEELDDIGDLRVNRHVVIRNEDFRELMNAGVLRLARHDTAPLDQDRRAATPREVASNDTVAHRPLRGG
jgi:hypothetical protein